MENGRESTVFNCRIKLDNSRDAYLIKALQPISRAHSISEFTETLFRLYFDNPKLVGSNISIIRDTYKSGASPCAKEFFDQASSEIKEMHSKIDDIYNMCLEMYTLAKFGNRFGLEKQTENMAKAQFMCERNLQKICRSLGIEDRSTFESCRIHSIDEKATDALEYIIQSYSGVVNEVTASASPVYFGGKFGVVPHNPPVDVSKPKTITTASDIKEDTIKNDEDTPITESGDSDDIIESADSNELKLVGYVSDSEFASMLSTASVGTGGVMDNKDFSFLNNLIGNDDDDEEDDY